MRARAAGADARGLLGAAIADLVRPLGITVVLSPALGGIVIGHEVARALGVRAMFAERQDGRLQLRRGFTLDAGERVLVVEDVVTTGCRRGRRSRWRARPAPRWSAPPRSSIAAAPRRIFGVPFTALLRIELPTYPAGRLSALCAGPAGREAGLAGREVTRSAKRVPVGLDL